jgi:hypothetical protein
VVSSDRYWTVEDPKEREKLPLYQIIPAAKPEELTPANGFPKRETFLTWHRSHGDNGNNIQCNPIIVRGVMPGCARYPHGQTPLAFSGSPARHLGPRHSRAAEPCDDYARWPACGRGYRRDENRQHAVARPRDG